MFKYMSCIFNSEKHVLGGQFCILYVDAKWQCKLTSLIPYASDSICYCAAWHTQIFVNTWYSSQSLSRVERVDCARKCVREYDVPCKELFHLGNVFATFLFMPCLHNMCSSIVHSRRTSAMLFRWNWIKTISTARKVNKFRSRGHQRLAIWHTRAWI